MEFEKLMEIKAIIDKVMQSETLKLLMNIEEEAAFSAFICVIIEEWALKHGADVVEVIERMHKASVDVNTRLGKYGKRSDEDEK